MDMALFGRMVASDPSLNYDASAQVAHASLPTGCKTNMIISPPWMTAPLRITPPARALGTVECAPPWFLYRYATVNLLELAGVSGKKKTLSKR